MKKIHNVLFALFVSAPLAAVSFGANAANIVETAAATGKFKTLITAVQAAGLADVLTGEGPFTVFAPTDDAFAQLPMGTVENLLKPENREQLVAILTGFPWQCGLPADTSHHWLKSQNLGYRWFHRIQ